MRGLALALALSGGANFLLNKSLPAPAPDPVGIRVETAAAVETASLFALGMRRLAADIGLIRLIIYYGTPEDHHAPGGPDHHGHEPGDPHHAHAGADYGRGDYPELASKAMRILDLDPAFSYPALFAAGALAFNMDKGASALEVLQYALKRDPKNYKYHAYIGAVGFHSSGDAQGVIRLLEPLLGAEDCPMMIKSMMAYLYHRTGHTAKAIALYRVVYGTSHDEGYRANARRRLAELGQVVN